MRIVFFDLETGGFDKDRHPIIQIAAIAVDEQLNELETYEAKIDFDVASADPEALQKNSYNAEAWERESRPDLHVCDELKRFLRKYSDVEMKSSRTGAAYNVAQLIGHNGDKFDGPFLQAWFKKRNAFLPASPAVLCTYQQAMSHFHRNRHLRRPNDFKLGTLYQHYFGVNLDGLHDAMTDVRANVQIYRAMLNEEQALVRAMDAMVPWALIGLNENHPAIQLARKLGITHQCAAHPEDLKRMEESLDK